MIHISLSTYPLDEVFFEVEVQLIADWCNKTGWYPRRFHRVRACRRISLFLQVQRPCCIGFLLLCLGLSHKLLRRTNFIIFMFLKLFLYRKCMYVCSAIYGLVVLIFLQFKYKFTRIHALHARILCYKYK